MDFDAFLRSLVAGNLAEVAVAAAAVTLFVWGLIEWVDSLYKKNNPQGLSHLFKFWLALALAFGVPLGAYALLQHRTQQPILASGLFVACGVGYAASQILHRMLEGPGKEPPGGTT